MKILKLAALLFSAPALACGPAAECYVCRSGFSPELADRPTELPLFYTQSQLYSNGKTLPSEVDPLAKLSHAEWGNFFQGKLKDQPLRNLVESTPINDIDSLIFSLQKKPAKLSETAKPILASLIQFDKELAIQALYYFGYARRCEPLIQQNEMEWFSEANDSENEKITKSDSIGRMLKLAEAGEKQVASLENKFLARRYRFQILRLYFYSRKYSEASAYFEKYRELFSTGDSISNRALSFAAGAAYRQKKFALGNYLFSLVYDRFAPLKISAFHSFSPHEEKDWIATLEMAKTTREKAVLWQLFGLKANGTRAIEKIYELDPKSDLLPLLLVREVGREEVSLFEEDRDTEKSAAPPPLALVQKIAMAGDTRDTGLWHLAHAHLLAISGDRAGAEKELTQAGSKKGSPDWAQQIRRTRLIARIHALKKPDPSLENYFASELTWLEKAQDIFENSRNLDTKNWSITRLSHLYRDKGDNARALLLEPNLSDPAFADQKTLDRFLALFANKKKSAFDRYLISQQQKARSDEPYSSSGGGITPSFLHDAKGIAYVYAGQYSKAAAEFHKNPDPQKLLADPFLIHNIDCHDCDFQAEGAGAMTFEKFATRLGELEKKMKAKGEDADEAAYDLANAFYNITWYGNARDFMGATPSKVTEASMKKAMALYQKAIDLSTDREFQATAAFMAAKAEHNIELAGGSRWENTLPNPGKYFELLTKNFSQTDYYKEILAECGYFKTFVDEGGKK